MMRPISFSSRRLSLALVCGAILTMIGMAEVRAETIPREVAVLRWLDKSTARVDTVRVQVNRTVKVQSLEVIVRACVENPPEETPESAAFLDIWETKSGEPASEVFRGWMFASSPALSAMEHPIYDVWVLGCEERSAATSAPENEQ